MHVAFGDGLRFGGLLQSHRQRMCLTYREYLRTVFVFLHSQTFDLQHGLHQEINPMLFDVLLGEEVRDSMVRSYITEGFSVGVLPTAHIIFDLH